MQVTTGAHLSMDSVSIIMLSAAEPAPTSSSIPKAWLTEEQKTGAWFTDGSVLHAGTIQKWTAVASQPLSGKTLKDTGKGKSS